MKILFYVEPELDFTVFRVLKIKGNRKRSIWTVDKEKVYCKTMWMYVGFGTFNAKRMNKYKD